MEHHQRKKRAYCFLDGYWHPSLPFVGPSIIWPSVYHPPLLFCSHPHASWKSMAKTAFSRRTIYTNLSLPPLSLSFFLSFWRRSYSFELADFDKVSDPLAKKRNTYLAAIRNDKNAEYSIMEREKAWVRIRRNKYLGNYIQAWAVTDCYISSE